MNLFSCVAKYTFLSAGFGHLPGSTGPQSLGMLPVVGAFIVWEVHYIFQALKFFRHPCQFPWSNVTPISRFTIWRLVVAKPLAARRMGPTTRKGGLSSTLIGSEIGICNMRNVNISILRRLHSLPCSSRGLKGH